MKRISLCALALILCIVLVACSSSQIASNLKTFATCANAVANALASSATSMDSAQVAKIKAWTATGATIAATGATYFSTGSVTAAQVEQIRNSLVNLGTLSISSNSTALNAAVLTANLAAAAIIAVLPTPASTPLMAKRAGFAVRDGRYKLDIGWRVRRDLNDTLRTSGETIGVLAGVK
jgi:hypothetical protein